MKKQSFRQTKAATLYRHPCVHQDCSKEGAFGYGPLRRPDLVRWYCFEHRPAA